VHVLTHETIIDATTLRQQAVRDLIDGFLRFEMWSRFAIHDIKQRFKRSLIGPFWLTLSMGVMVGVLGLISSSIFQQDMAGVLPYIAVGLIFWGFLTSCINEGAEVFIGSARYIRNIPMQLSIHLYRMIARNIIILGFNMMIYVLILVIFPHPLNLNYFLVLPGFALYLINVAWAAFVVAVLSARYRDIPHVISNLVQVIFFLTPVFWSAAKLPTRPAFVTWNPVYHMLEIVRSPLLGERPSVVSWSVSGICALTGCACVLLLYRRAYPRISYWV
jgi:ABC-type polysaccharide/polyol phosphate export permease